MVYNIKIPIYYDNSDIDFLIHREFEKVKVKYTDSVILCFSGMLSYKHIININLTKYTNIVGLTLDGFYSSYSKEFFIIYDILLKFKHIKHLTINNFQIIRHKMFDNMSNLQTLCIKNSHCVSNINFVKKLNNLEIICLYNNYFLNDISALAKQNSIEELEIYIYNCHIFTSTMVNSIKTLRLHGIHIVNEEMSDSLVSSIYPLILSENIQYLHIGEQESKSIHSLSKYFNISFDDVYKNLLYYTREYLKIRNRKIMLDQIINI